MTDAIRREATKPKDQQRDLGIYVKKNSGANVSSGESVNKPEIQGVNSSIPSRFGSEAKPRMADHSVDEAAAALSGFVRGQVQEQQEFLKKGFNTMLAQKIRNDEEISARSVSTANDNPVGGRPSPAQGSFTNKGSAAPGQKIGNLSTEQASTDASRDKTASYVAWGIGLGLAAIAIGLIVTDTVTVGAKTPAGAPLANGPKIQPGPLPY